jgi:enamine deaminase RidA (YjgF/YER057c/UK114 family)
MKRDWPHPALGPAPYFSRALEVPNGRIVFFSGQVPTDETGATIARGDMAGQADACFAKIKAMLEAAGGAIDDVAKINLFVTDMSRMGEVRRVRETYFTKPPFPAMTGVQVVALAEADWLIEIEAIAVIPE